MIKRFVFISVSFIIIVITSCETMKGAEEEITLEESFLLIEEEVPYSQGAWEGSEFASRWFGFRYRPTQGIILTSEDALKDINAVQSMNIDGPNAELVDYTKMQIAYEVMARSGDGTTTLEVLSEKIFADDFTVEQYIEILAMELTITHGRDVVFNEQTTRLLGNTYYLDLSATINIEGTTVYQTVLLSRKGDRFATVLLNYRTPEKMEEVLKGFAPF